MDAASPCAPRSRSSIRTLRRPRSGTPNVSPRILDNWQTTYELAGDRTKDGLERAQAATAAAVNARSRNLRRSGRFPPTSPLARHPRASLARGGVGDDRAKRWPRAPARARFHAGAGGAWLVARNAAGQSLEGWRCSTASSPHDPLYGKARSTAAGARSCGRLDDALDDAERACVNSPLTRGCCHARLADPLRRRSRTRPPTCPRALDLRPDAADLQLVISIADSLQGFHEAAISAAKRASAVPGDPCLSIVLAYVLARPAQARS